MKTCYNKQRGVMRNTTTQKFRKAKSSVMRFIHKTILILSLLIPVVLYASSEMTADDKVDEKVISEMNVRIIHEKPFDEIIDQELTIKSYIQNKFGSNWKLAYAVMMSESHGRKTARNVNSSGSVDNGYWQINDYYHPQITLECAQDIVCSTDYAYKLSKSGTDWSAWYGYLHGGYKQFID